jgi:hypothetical protein
VSGMYLCIYLIIVIIFLRVCAYDSKCSLEQWHNDLSKLEIVNFGHPSDDRPYERCLTSAIVRPSAIYTIHHQRPLIPPTGVGTICFLLPFSSITRHLYAHAFYSHIILHQVHPYFLRATSTRVHILIRTHYSFVM